MSSDLMTPRINNRTGHSSRRRRRRSSATAAAMLDDENPGIASVVSTEEDDEESSTSGDKLYEKTVSHFQNLLEALVNGFCSSKHVTSALNSRKNNFIINAPTHVIYDALIKIEKELAQLHDDALSKEQLRQNALFPWATNETLKRKDKSLDTAKQNEKDRNDLVFLLLQIFKIAFAAFEKTGTNAGTKEAVVYLFEAVTTYEKGDQCFKDFFESKSIASFLTEEQNARAKLAKSKLSGFEYKTEAKKLLIEAIVGDDRLSEFVQEFDADKAFNQGIVEGVPLALKNFVKANADRKRVATNPPMSKKGLEQYWIDTGPDGRVPGGGALTSDQSLNQTAKPAVKASSTHPELDSPEVRALLEGDMTLAERSAIGARLDELHPGHGYWDSSIKQVQQAFPGHVFAPPAAAQSGAEALGAEASAPAPASEVAGTDTTGLAEPKPNFTLEGFMQNDLVRSNLDEKFYQHKEFYQNMTTPETSRELAAAGLLWAPGRDQFWIVKKLGSGGEGSVFKIVSKHGKAAALKLSMVEKSRVSKDVVRSMMCNCQVDHENVAQPLGWFAHKLEEGPKKTKNKCILFAQFFELCADYTLEDEIAKISSAEPSAKICMVVDIVAKIASAVAALEKAGVLHRDIKPENIFFDTLSSELKIGDFGMSRFAGDGEKMTLGTGTAIYAAPETKTSTSQGVMLDVFCTGIIIYELVTGSLPWKDEETKKLQYMAIAEEAFKHSSIIELLDKKGGKEIVELSKQMLSDPTNRPTMSTVLSETKKIQAAISEELDESV